MEAFREVLCLIILKVVKTYFRLKKLVFKGFSKITDARVRKVLKKCGIQVDGSEPWDIRVKDNRFFHKVAAESSLGLGESYTLGWWDCDRLDEFSYRIMRGALFRHALTRDNKILHFLMFNAVNLQTKEKSLEVARKHYDLGNELFQNFLDPTLNYSCGYWRNTDNLNQAQLDKMELIAKKLKLKPGMRVLDIGCGWGSLCKYLAEKYDVNVVGCNISVEQVKYAQKLCKGLNVEIRMEDYRDLNENFDRVVSVGMFEHVGELNYSTFFQTVRRCLVEDGLFLLHTIGVNHPDQPLTEPWAHRYIFPNGILPYHQHITKYSDGLFIIEDWHNFGFDYSRTLRAWYDNFVKNWPQMAHKYDECFYRMWTYYLLMASGAFRARRFQAWQIVFSKDGLEGGYSSLR